jgi:hypothetical protein
VRVLGAHDGTDTVVRALIESGNAERRWSTVDVSTNVIEAGWQALVDSIEYRGIGFTSFLWKRPGCTCMCDLAPERPNSGLSQRWFWRRVLDTRSKNLG